MQVLPFAFDFRNTTGAYQTMVANCNDEDGVSRCFYKVGGWGTPGHGHHSPTYWLTQALCRLCAGAV